MEFNQRNFASVGFLLFAIVGLPLLLRMPSSAAAAFTCDPSTEVYVGGNKTHTDRDGGTSCNQCPGEIQTLCNSKGRTVSKYECNWWDHAPALRTTVCIGCCGAPTPSPPATDKCQAGDVDLSFRATATRPWDCGKCQNGCKDKCDLRNETVSREMCVFAGAQYDCNCCCRKPSPPSPSLPPVNPENTCDAKDVYIAFQLPKTSGCDSCLGGCEAKCSKLGSSVATECCERKSSAVFCKCCCE